MGIFKKKQPMNEAAAVRAIDAQLDEMHYSEVNYATVVDWLVGLSQEDYEKATKIAMIYRNANAESCTVLGENCEPTTFIKQPQRDELVVPEPVFLEDELPVRKEVDHKWPNRRSKAKKVEIK